MYNDRPCVIIESPFRGDIQANIYYADCLMVDAIGRGEAPFLGHLLYPRVLNDGFDIQRDAGIECHLAWLSRANYIVVGMDLSGPSSGMQAAIDLGERLKIEVRPRWLGEGWGSRYQLNRTPEFR